MFFLLKHHAVKAIIFPILREVYKDYSHQYSLWIQKSIAYGEDLSGTPDYIIATKSILGKTVLGEPLLIIVETKKNDFEQGWGQCLAALVTAQKTNGDASLPVQGIVTDGKLWEFGQLTEDLFIKNWVYSGSFAEPLWGLALYLSVWHCGHHVHLFPIE